MPELTPFGKGVSRDIWPLPTTKPGIKGIFLAYICCAIYYDFFLVNARVKDPVVTILLINKGRNWDAPGDLAANIPVTQVFKIFNQHTTLAFRCEGNLAALKALNSARCQWFNVYKPLLFNHWLNWQTTLVIVTNSMGNGSFATQ